MVETAQTSDILTPPPLPREEQASKPSVFPPRKTYPPRQRKNDQAQRLALFGVISVVPVVALATHFFFLYQQELETIWQQFVALGRERPFELCFASCALCVLCCLYVCFKKRSVYLIDFSTLHPPDELKVSHEYFRKHTEEIGVFSQEAKEFQFKVLEKSEISSDAYFPEGIMKNPPSLNMEYARKEADYVFETVLDDLFHKTGTDPKDIDILIVNCSLFNPTPSLSSIIVNKYKMRKTIKTYNLGGMGCSAGLISIDLANQLLQARPNSLCLVVSTENITQNWYLGKMKSMLLSNTLFRMGGAAILLSNKPKDSWRAKYELQHVVRVHLGANEEAYHAVFQHEDPEGIRGVALSKKLMDVAGDAIRANLNILGVHALPLSEQLKFVINFVQRKVLKHKIPAYVPNFQKAFRWGCIHAGGKAVLDAIEKSLGLTKDFMAPSRYVLYRWGNVSSASVWYELEAIEEQQPIKKGHKVWQLTFGSGFKCQSAVWKRLARGPKK